MLRHARRLTTATADHLARGWPAARAWQLSSSAAATPDTDCVVVGAGVVGLACARAAAQAGWEVVLLEAAPSFGTGTSSRHSEVIHAGIYYPPGSRKARLCVEGRQALYEFCSQRGVAAVQLGKLIVATHEQQVPKLKQLQATAARCGVTNLQLLSGSEAVALEPSLSAAAALLSPSTGILDSHAYMAALLQDAEGAGAVFAPNSRLLAAQQVPGSTFVPAAASGSSGSGGGSTQATRPLLQLDVQDTGSGAVSRLRTRWVVNAAGLSAQDVARRISPAPAAIPRQHLAKGNYFSLAGKAPFSRLIYPLPGDGGLGVHLTLDLGGAARFGPDVEWLPPPASDGANGSAEAQLDYSVDSARAAAFYPVIRQYYPGLQDGALVPAYSGIRPKLHGPGQPAADFVLQGSAEHGVRGLISLFGIESPGLTSSLAIAGEVVRMMPEA